MRTRNLPKNWSLQKKAEGWNVYDNLKVKSLNVFPKIIIQQKFKISMDTNNTYLKPTVERNNKKCNFFSIKIIFLKVVNVNQQIQTK